MLGKLSQKQLNESVLNILKHRRKEVILGGKAGEDCAVLKLDDFVILSTDPITCAASDMGSLAIDVCVNDIASSGGEPVCALLTILAPPNESVESIAKVMRDAEEKATLHNLEIVGGHTEYTDAVNRTVVICAIVGVCKKPVFSTTMQEGDDILMTKYAGLEGTNILINDHAESISENELQELKSQSLSVLKEGKILATQEISAMHDITEGGVYGAVFELLENSNFSAEVFENSIPVLNVTRRICQKLTIKPQKLISSGSMLIFAKNGKKLCELLKKININCTVIGKVTKKKDYVLKIIDTGEIIENSDEELYKLWRKK